MNSNFKYVVIGATAALLFSGCGSSSSNGGGGGSPSTNGSVQAGSVAALLTASSSLSSSSHNVGDSVSVSTSYVPLTAISNSVTVSSIAVSQTGTAWTVDGTHCVTTINESDTCYVEVGFDGAAVAAANDLKAVVLVTYSDNSVTSTPVVGAITTVDTVVATLPEVISPNTSGYASGTINVYNGSSESQTLDASTIAANTQQGVTWTFSPNCDGNDGSVVAAGHSCAVYYTYQVTSGTTPSGNVTVTIPVTNNSTGVVSNVVTNPAVQQPVPTSSSTYLVYTGPSVFVPEGESTTFIVQNTGQAALTNLTASATSGFTVSLGSNCANLAAGAICTATVTQESSTATGSVLLTPTPASPSSVTVALSGQVGLGVSPLSINYGDVSGGTQANAVVVVTNYSESSAAVDASLIDESGVFATPVNYCSSVTLPAWGSCSAVVRYNAPITAGSNSASLIVYDITNSESTTVALAAMSTVATWVNLIHENPPMDYTVYPILSLAVNEHRGLTYFGVSPEQGSGVTGNRNVWSVESDGSTYHNFTESKTGYESSAPTALTYHESNVYIGTYNGVVQVCHIESTVCTVLATASTSSYGATSIISHGNLLAAGFSNSTTGTTGELIAFVNESPVRAINGAAIGKMANDESYAYVPFNSSSASGISKADESGNVTTGLAPTTLGSGEYPTVVYVSRDDSTLFFGTSAGNVYKSTVRPESVTSSDWTLLTTTPLSTSSFVSGIELGADGTLYVGLANLKSPATGGALFSSANAGTTFTTANGYSDTSSVSSMRYNALESSVLVSTYAGKLWKQN